jgi:hypothetical protein
MGWVAGRQVRERILGVGWGCLCYQVMGVEGMEEVVVVWRVGEMGEGRR